MKKKTLRLKDDHGWEANPGFKIFVADRGAMRFDFPQDWFVDFDKKSVKFLDAEPPNDNCRLEASFNRLPPADWSQLPLKKLLQDVMEHDERNVTSKSEIISIDRDDLKIVWAELGFIDPEENRDAFSRILIGLGGNVQCLVTFDVWADEIEKFAFAWDEMLRSLKLGMIIPDPARGFAVDPRLN